jgi:2,3-diaminopropionate biosynthesis protein SbnB
MGVSVIKIERSKVMITQTKKEQSRQGEVFSPNLLYLSKENVIQAGGELSTIYVQAITEVLTKHAEGKFVQPLKPYIRTQVKTGHIADRIIAMPAHIGGDDPVSGIKWIGSKHDNPSKRKIERASGLIILNDPKTNYPIAMLEASLISSMRTAAVTVVAAKYLARNGFQKVSCLGCGIIAKRQLHSLVEQFPHIQTIYLFDINPQAAQRFAKECQAAFPTVEFIVEKTAEVAVRQGEVVVTCTVADQPYIEYDWLQKGSFLCNISIMDVHKDVFIKADKVVVDDWEQSNREKKVLHQLVQEGRFSREQLYAELGEIVIGDIKGRENDEEIIILNPMGMAIEDIECAYKIYQKAIEENIGTSLSLY